MASTARRLSLRCTAKGSLDRAAEPRLGSIPLDGPFATTPTLPPRCPKPRPPQVRQARVRGAGGARGRRRRVPAPARARGPRAARRRRSGGRAFCRAGRRRRRRRRQRGVGPVARRRPRRGLGPLGAHAADVVASHRSRRPRGSLAVAPSRPGVLSFFRVPAMVIPRAGPWAYFEAARPLPHKYAIAATVILTQGPSPRCGARARGPPARSRSTVLPGVCFFQRRGVIARLLPPRRYSVERILASIAAGAKA